MSELLDKALVLRAANAAGGELLPDKGVWTNRIEIRSESSERLYVVAQHKENGTWGCNCPGWIIKRPGQPRSCKHLQVMTPLLDAPTPRETWPVLAAPGKGGNR